MWQPGKPVSMSLWDVNLFCEAFHINSCFIYIFWHILIHINNNYKVIWSSFETSHCVLCLGKAPGKQEKKIMAQQKKVKNWRKLRVRKRMCKTKGYCQSKKVSVSFRHVSLLALLFCDWRTVEVYRCPVLALYESLFTWLDCVFLFFF